MIQRRSSGRSAGGIEVGATGRTDALRRIRAILVSRAKRGGLITYSDLARRIRPRVIPNSIQLSDWLTTISLAEYSARRGLLSAVVVRKRRKKGFGIPGVGFFAKLPLRIRKREDRRKCWQREVENVWGYWKSHRGANR
jgi:hypothetical protein